MTPTRTGMPRPTSRNLRPLLMVALAWLALGATSAAAERSGRVVLLVRGDRATEVEAAANAAIQGQGLDIVEPARVEAQITAQGLPNGGLPTENQLRGLALMFDARAVLVIQSGSAPDGRSVATIQVVSPERPEVPVQTVTSAPDQLPVQVAVAVSQLDLSLAEPPDAAVAAPTTQANSIPPAPGPPMYTPTVPAPVVVEAEPVRAEHTGSTAALFFPFAPAGSTELRNTASPPAEFGSDWVHQLGFGGYLAGLGRKVGGGVGMRAMWWLHGDDITSDESNKAIDIYGLIRIRHRRDFWEAYLNLEFGNSFQIAKLALPEPTSDVTRNRGWGFNFAILPGIRFDIGPDAGFFLEGGFLYRFVHFDRRSEFNLNTVQRMFILQTGFTFGA